MHSIAKPKLEYVSLIIVTNSIASEINVTVGARGLKMVGGLFSHGLKIARRLLRSSAKDHRTSHEASTLVTIDKTH